MNITLTGTKIMQDTKFLAFEKNNGVDVINITVDTDESWTYKLDVKYPEKCCSGKQLYNIIDLTRNGNVCTAVLTKAMLPFTGKYIMQLRAINSDKVQHSDTFDAWVKYSIEPSETYNPVPSEFYQIENNITEMNNNPPYPSDDGYWMIWDTDSHDYKKSDIQITNDSTAADVRMQVAGGYIQYSTDGGANWNNLIAMEDLIGAPGKTAYDYAVDAGYTGTEAEFSARMAAEIPTVDGTLTQSGQAADAAAVRKELDSVSEENKVIKSALDAKVGTEELDKNSETLGTLTVKDSDGNVLGVYDGGSKEIVIPASTGGGGSHAWNLITNLSVSDAQDEYLITVDDSGNAFAYDEILVLYPSPAVGYHLYFRGGVTGAESKNCQIWLTNGKAAMIQFSLMGGYFGISSVMRNDGPVGFMQGLGGNATMDKIRTILIGAYGGFTAAGTIQIYGR